MTSEQWWNKIKNSNKALSSWLKDQYHGEVTAAERIKELASKVEDRKASKVLNMIAEQEADHASWIQQLLLNRGLPAEVLNKNERYWSKTLPKEYASMPVEKLAAIGAHAEAMRLERIKVIANDPQAPADIKAVFARILPQEEFHERAFREMAGADNMKAALLAHEEGLAALGLTI